MSVGERDPISGHMTTGHEWNGIIELNTPVPKIVWFFLGAAFIFSVIYWILMPAWPLGVTYTKGLLGIDQRTRVEQNVQQAIANRSEWTEKIAAMDYAAIQADPSLMHIVRETGSTLFGDNCSVCHGAMAQGGHGYPRLTDSSWLWGGDPETIDETLRVGINSEHPETRFAQMMAFGRDQMLDRDSILNVVSYVQSLSDPAAAEGEQADAVAAGATVFAENCTSCHGEDGTGLTDVGAPNLTDDFWIYGGDRQSIFDTVWYGRQGHMPAWEARLTPVDRKILTLYVLDLGAATP